MTTTTDTCSIAGCTTALTARSYRGMCERHYKIELASGRLEKLPKPESRPATRRDLREVGLDVFEWLIAGGTPVEAAARRVGRTIHSITGTYRRHGWTVPPKLVDADSRSRSPHGAP